MSELAPYTKIFPERIKCPVVEAKKVFKGRRTEILFRVKANNRRMLRPTKAHGNDESEKLRAHLKKSMRYK